VAEIKPLGDPDDLDVLEIIPLGLSGQSRRQGKEKVRALAEVPHRERFVQTFQ
jgi:hypothetical protein